MLITNSQLMIFIDVPVDTSQQTKRLVFYVTSSIAILEACILLILICNLLSHFRSHVVIGISRINARRISFFLGFCTYEIEQFIFDNCATQCTTKCTCILFRHRILLVITKRTVFTIHIFIREIRIRCSLQFVCTLFSNSIDTTTGKSTLTNIERSNNNLDFLNGIHRNRISTRLTTIRSGSRQTEHVITYRTINLETVITVI